METSNIRKRMPVSALLDPKIVIPAIELRSSSLTRER